MPRGVESWRDGPDAGDTPARTPILNAPPIVTLIVGIIISAFLIAAVLPSSLKGLVYYYASVQPLRVLHPQANVLGALVPLPAHMLLHDGVVHVGLNSVWLLAFGTPVARRMGANAPARVLRRRPALAFAALFVASGIAGALAFIALHPNEPSYLMGASGGVSGLLGALVRFAFRPPTSEALAGEISGLLEPPILIWTAVILALNVFVGIFSAAVGFGGSNIAWEAHVGGYLFGLAAFPAFLALARGK